MILFNNIPHRADDILGFFLRHSGVKGKRYNAAKMFLCIWEIAFLVAESTAVGAHQMHRDKMHACTDISLVQLNNELIAVNSEFLRYNAQDI